MTVCRVCLAEVAPWSALELGCACREAPMHRECAVAWFGSRSGSDCEVCARPLGAAAVAVVRRFKMWARLSLLAKAAAENFFFVEHKRRSGRGLFCDTSGF